MENQLRWIDFLPLAIFSYGSRLGLVGADGSWTNAFYLGAGLALLKVGYLWYRGLKFDYIALGTTLFLIYGALGYALHKPLLVPYDIFMQSVIFLWIFIVGIIATVATKEGFIQLPDEYHKHTRIGSLALLGATGIALLISYCLVSYTAVSTGIGVVMPFVLLLLGREAMRTYFIKRA